MPSFGELGALLAPRLAAGLTQEALAERAGLSAKASATWSAIRAARRGWTPSALLADALGHPGERADLLAAARPPPRDRRPPGRARRVPAGPPRPLTPLIGRDGVAAAVVGLLRRGDSGC